MTIFLSFYQELAEQFKQQFTSIEWNSEKYITFTVPVEKEVTRIDKKVEEIIRNISYILQFIDAARLMASLLTTLVNNLFEEIHKTKYKYQHMIKYVKLM